MSISKIGALSTRTNTISFKSSNSGKTDYENPVNRETEKNLAILSSVGGSAIAGVIVYGIARAAKGGGGTWQTLAGIGAGAVVLALTLPAAIYNRKVSAFVKQKEVDVFSRDRNLKSNLIEEVDKEVQDSKVSLDKKLDDNLKLQMANRGAALGLANITPQAQ